MTDVVFMAGRAPSARLRITLPVPGSTCWDQGHRRSLGCRSGPHGRSPAALPPHSAGTGCRGRSSPPEPCLRCRCEHPRAPVPRDRACSRQGGRVSPVPCMVALPTQQGQQTRSLPEALSQVLYLHLQIRNLLCCQGLQDWVCYGVISTCKRTQGRRGTHHYKSSSALITFVPKSFFPSLHLSCTYLCRASLPKEN